MENNTVDTTSNYYIAAEKLLKEHGKTNDEVRMILVEKGAGYDEASAIVDSFNIDNKAENSTAGNKDMLYGALWCVGGTVLTISNTGYIFWGAILFGGIQFIRGVVAKVNS